jgi:fructose-1,6-bisphosphatase/inositol monophosphatase family enzyme
VNDEYLDFAKSLAAEAGRIMEKYFEAEEIGLEIKGDQTPVTLADTEINSLVINKVKECFPEHGVFGEEESYNTDKESLWIVDPLDGTPNFARGVPVFAFSIALVVHGTPKVAVVSDPNTGRVYSATEGQGAYENDKQLNLRSYQPKGNQVLSCWVVGGVNGSVISSADIDGKLEGVFGKKGGYVLFDLPIAYVLPMVGAGRLDACITSVINPWDLAAGCLIAKEAGAKITDLFGEEIKIWNRNIRGVTVAAPDIHAQIMEIISPELAAYK